MTIDRRALLRAAPLLALPAAWPFAGCRKANLSVLPALAHPKPNCLMNLPSRVNFSS